MDRDSIEQTVGTRIYYGEPATGLGHEFNHGNKAEEFTDYLRYIIRVLQQNDIDIKDPEFEHNLIMSDRSMRNFQADSKNWMMHSGFVQGFFIIMDGVKFKTFVTR
jgi:hypothetical protein